MIPPTMASLRSACRKPPDDHSVFEGSLAEIGIVPLLELIERSELSGRLVLWHGSEWVAIDWIHGRIAGARAVGAADSPSRALGVAAGWQDGTFQLLPIAFDGERGTYTVAQVLLESAYEGDEAARGQSAQTARP